MRLLCELCTPPYFFDAIFLRQHAPQKEERPQSLGAARVCPRVCSLLCRECRLPCRRGVIAVATVIRVYCNCLYFWSARTAAASSNRTGGAHDENQTRVYVSAPPVL